MTQNPILKVLSILHGCQVRFLLIGGQACILYGGSEFSRDTDVTIHPDPQNLKNLENALSELQADCIAVPQLSLNYLSKGHAVHFRCKHPEAKDMRIDVMAVLRNAEPFEKLWERRTTVNLEEKLSIDVISLPDLIAVKKTQRDKDWSHIRRLIEAHYSENHLNPSVENIRFWLAEARTPGLLKIIALNNPKIVEELKSKRQLLSLLPDSADDEIQAELVNEEKVERDADRRYWEPLLKELEKIRLSR